MSKDPISLGLMIAKRRLELGNLSRRAAADMCGISESVMRNIERGSFAPAPGLFLEYTPSEASLRKVCDGLGLDPNVAFDLAGLELQDDITPDRSRLQDLEQALQTAETAIQDARRYLAQLRSAPPEH